MLGDCLAMDSQARGPLNLTMSMHREEQTVAMLFIVCFILALMLSGYVYEPTLFY